MKTNMTIITALLLSLWSLPQTWAQAEKEKAPTIVKSVGGKYTTSVTRETHGELGDEDFRQASLLGSRILVHLEKATTALLDEKPDLAEPELEHANVLVGVIRDVLPVTEVITVVRDEAERELYRYVDRVQDDRLPIFQHMIAVEVIEPIIEAKEASGTPEELKGLRLADAEFINTSALLDLSLVERKIDLAMAQLNQPDEALKSLLVARSAGVDFIARKEESPLVDAHSALRLSERLIDDERFEAAEENLSLARFHLDTYRQLVGEEAGDAVKTLQEEIREISGKLKGDGASDKVRGFWSEVASWFIKEPGQTETTTVSDGPTSQSDSGPVESGSDKNS